MKSIDSEWGSTLLSRETTDGLTIEKLLQEDLLTDLDYNDELIVDEITIDCICGVY